MKITSSKTVFFALLLLLVNWLQPPSTLAAPGKTSASKKAPVQPVVRPEKFGAKGDGKTNDTLALAKMAEFVNKQGGGTIELRRGATYMIGIQKVQPFPGSYAYEPEKVLEFAGCTRPLVIRGNGAKIKCVSGLKFGTFDPKTGAVTNNPLPFYGIDQVASPYRWMIKVEGATSSVVITDLELDGSVEKLQIGGGYDTTGRQLPATGIGFYNNTGVEIVRNVYSHHHALDGIIIDDVSALPDDAPADIKTKLPERTFTNVRCEYNVRQGVSIVGGANYQFKNCRFNHTGKAAIASAPAGGVDIEAEGGKLVRDLRFIECEFSNNIGPGVVADQGDGARATFEKCTFIGTTNWSAWPNKPYMRFVGCRFVGPVVNAFGDKDKPERATQFEKCEFLDDPKLSPTGEVYIGENTDGPIAVLPYSYNARFKDCTFKLTHAHALPWTGNFTTFEDCTMSQVSPKTAYPRGTFVGTNTIVGKVDLYAAIIKGKLTVNGDVIPPTP